MLLSQRRTGLTSFQPMSLRGCALGSAAGGRRPLESADPRDPACGSMEGERESGYLNQKLPTEGRGPLHPRRKNLSYLGRLWRVEPRLSCGREPNSSD